MILKTKCDRVILWGCTVGEDSIFAQLAFFDANLYANSYLLTTLDGQTRIPVSLPDEVKGQHFPAKSQNAAISIIGSTTK